MKRKKGRRKTVPHEAERERLARDLALVVRYWAETVRPFIADRRLCGAEFHIAQDAHWRLRETYKQVAQWNTSEAGRLNPIPLSDLPKPEFRRPADDPPTAHQLAAIAAAASAQQNLSPDEAIGRALDLFNAAKRRLASQPQNFDIRPEAEAAHFAGLNACVSIKEIYESNQNESGRLPLLPPMQKKKKGRTPTGTQTIPAIRVAIKRSLKPADAPASSNPQSLASGERAMQVSAVGSRQTDVRIELARKIAKALVRGETEKAAQLQKEHEVLEGAAQQIKQTGKAKRDFRREWQYTAAFKQLKRDGILYGFDSPPLCPQPSPHDLLKKDLVPLWFLCVLRWERFKSNSAKQAHSAGKR